MTTSAKYELRIHHDEVGALTSGELFLHLYHEEERSSYINYQIRHTDAEWCLDYDCTSTGRPTKLFDRQQKRLPTYEESLAVIDRLLGEGGGPALEEPLRTKIVLAIATLHEAVGRLQQMTLDFS